MLRTLNGALSHGPVSQGTDSDLWAAARKGDPEAYGTLYERHVHAIYNYLFRRLADWSEAEDLTAIVFLEAFRRRNQVTLTDGKVLPWLYGVATNVLRNRRRSQWYHRETLRRLAQHHVGPSVNRDAAERLEAEEEMRALLRRLRALPRKQQDVVALCLWSGLTYEEAAEALGVPVGTVRSRLSRARAALGELPGTARHEDGDGPYSTERMIRDDQASA